MSSTVVKKVTLQRFNRESESENNRKLCLSLLQIEEFRNTQTRFLSVLNARE